MENPNFEGSSSAFKLPDLGTTKKASVKSIDEIVAKPTVVNFENAERGQVSDKKMQPILKKHIMSKKWTKLEIGMTAVNFIIILCFFIGSLKVLHFYYEDGKELRLNMTRMAKKADKLINAFPKLIKIMKNSANEALDDVIDDL